MPSTTIFLSSGTLLLLHKLLILTKRSGQRAFYIKINHNIMYYPF